MRRLFVYAISALLLLAGTSGAALMATQKGPYSANRPSFTSPGGYEFYDTTSATFKAHKGSDVAAQLTTETGEPTLLPQKIVSAGNFTSTIDVGPLGTFAVRNGTTWRVITNSSVTSFAANSASAACPSCTAFAYSYMRWYVYAYDSSTLPAGPTLNFEVSYVPPDSTLRYKNGDTSRLYVGTFRNNNSIVERFQYRDGVYTLLTGPQYVVTQYPAPTSYTSVNLAGSTPFTNGSYSISAFAKIVFMRLEWQGSSTGTTVYVSPDCSNDQNYWTSGTTNYTRTMTQINVIPGSPMCYRVDSSNTQVYMFVTGFIE